MVDVCGVELDWQELQVPDPTDRDLLALSFYFLVHPSCFQTLLIELSGRYPSMSAPQKEQFRLLIGLRLAGLKRKPNRSKIRSTTSFWGLPSLTETDCEKLQELQGHVSELQEKFPMEVPPKLLIDYSLQELEEFFAILARIEKFIPGFMFKQIHAYNYFAWTQQYRRSWRVYLCWPFEKDVFKFFPKRWRCEDLRGKRVLIWMCKSSLVGYGDIINYCRFVPILERLGVDCLVSISSNLRRLILHSFPSLKEWNSRQEFDVFLCARDLPRAINYTPEKYDSYRYLKPPESAVNLDKYGSNRPRVGVCYSASDREFFGQGLSEQLEGLFRTIKFPIFSKILEGSEATFFSLQPDRDVREAIKGTSIIDVGDQMRDFGDTAAAIVQLDLVITVDTALAHLAGALGKETWILLPKRADTRWGLTETDSCWYSNVRLFRQQQTGTWQPVIDQVRKELNLFCKKSS